MISKLYPKRLLSIICAVMVLLSLALPVFSPAEDDTDNNNENKKMAFHTEQKYWPKGEFSSQPISLNLKDIDIIEALKFLAEKVDCNIITTKSVAGRVSLTVNNVPIKDVFDVMLRSNGLAYVRQASIYNVMTEPEYKALYGKSFSDMRQVKIARLQYAPPDQAFNLLDALKSEVGRVLVDAESGNILIMDTPEKINQMQVSLAEFEKRNKVEVFSLRYAKAKEVEDILKTQLDTKKVGSIRADERNNQVMVQAFPERMQEIASLIKSLDRQTKEVLIDTKIVKITLSDQLDNGVEWEGIFSLARSNGLTYLGSYPFSSVQATTGATFKTRETALKELGDSAGSYPFSGTSIGTFNSSQKISPGQNIHVGVVSKQKDYDAMMQLLQTLGETRIIFNPKIVAVNNQEAKIHVGERQAYVTTTTTTGGSTGTNTIAEEVTFVDVGVQLAVTPTINDDGYITMKVKPEVSSVTSTLTTPTNNKIPILDTSLAETTVMVQDGNTVIIGGLRKEERTKSYEQVPFLGKVPFLGYFFRSGNQKKIRNELVVMLTPHIISGDRLVTADEREFSHDTGRKYEDYRAIAAEKTLASRNVPAQADLKPYREFKEDEEKDSSIKEEKHEPD